MGQQIDSMPEALSCREDVEFEHAGEPFVRYYKSMGGDDLTSLGTSGTVEFITDYRGQIVDISGIWVLDGTWDEKEKLIARREILAWLPYLRGALDFERHKTVKWEGKDFQEEEEIKS